MQYAANVKWKRNENPFNTKSFDRTHQVTFGSGTSVDASSAPEFLGRSDLPNPEELFTAAISSCFMLTFLYWAAAEGIIIDEYYDDARGLLGKNGDGKMAMVEVKLHPKVVFQNNNIPDPAVLSKLYKKAHDNCFISSSVKTTVTVGD